MPPPSLAAVAVSNGAHAAQQENLAWLGGNSPGHQLGGAHGVLQLESGHAMASNAPAQVRFVFCVGFGFSVIVYYLWSGKGSAIACQGGERGNMLERQIL